MRRLLLSALIATLALGGCIRPRPKTGPQASQPLDVPPPPPRVIVLPEPEEPAEDSIPAAADEPASKDKPKTSSRRLGARPPQPDAAKPVEPPKPETPLPPVETAVKPPAGQPPVALQPELKASTQETTKQVEGQLAQAAKDLDRVHYQGLNADAKTQYDAAKQFIAQARTALREGNLVFAQKLAEKAVGLASNLVPR